MTVGYTHQLDYPYGADQRCFPGLLLRIWSPDFPEQALETDAYWDSGAERSLFDGQIGRALGLDLLGGRPIPYRSTAGREVEGRLHQVRFSHPDLGSFQLEIGFSIEPISRNLLGRDFFNLIQVGFRERYLAVYMTPSP